MAKESDVCFDFVVVGSGFGGSVSALRLSEKGYSVAVLEAGLRFDDDDFPRSNWNVFKSIWWPALRCFGTLRLTPLDDVLVLGGAGVGGGSLTYCNTLLEPPPTFYRDPQWGEMADWQRVLAPHYARAKQMLGVARCTKATPADELLEAVAQQLGCANSFRLQDVGVFLGEPEKTVPDPYFDGAGPSRCGCRFCGGCMVGCRYNAKNTLVKNYLYLAEQHDVKVFPNTTVSLIRPAEHGYRLEAYRTTSLLRRSRRSFHAKQVVIAAGVLGTLRLLFRCRDAGALSGLSPMLGRRVRTNSEALNGVSAKRSQIDYSEGISITSSVYVDDVTHVEPVRFPRGSDLLSVLATPLTDGRTPWRRRLRWFANIFLHPLVFLRSCWPFGWAQRTVIFLVMQTLDNSIQVLSKRRWWWPFSRRLASRREDRRQRVPALIPQAQKVARVAAEQMNGWPQNAVNEVVLNMGTTAHVLGGCAIGADTAHGVVDEHHRVYGHPGLFVVDGSTIPANLGVNPSLTITALAEHAMSHIPPKH